MATKIQDLEKKSRQPSSTGKTQIAPTPRPDTCRRCGLGIASHGKGWPLAKLSIPGVRNVPEHRFIPSDSTERRDRSTYDRDELLAEIINAEAILDGMGAKPGLTLWGRIASIKDSK